MLCPRFLYYSGHQKAHIVGHKDFGKSYKSIHGENLDIGLGNHLNPRRSSKCTVFMTGFLGAACGSPYIVFISTSGMLCLSDRYMYIYIILYI